MRKVEQQVRYFVGRPFPDSMIDEQRTYTAANAQVEQDTVFQDFLKSAQLTNERASMLVFGEQGFMYWYGVEVSASTAAAAQGLLKFELPHAQVAQEELLEQPANTLNLPLNIALPTFLKKAVAADMPLYENLADSPVPYFCQKLNLQTKKLTQVLYLQVSE